MLNHGRTNEPISTKVVPLDSPAHGPCHNVKESSHLHIALPQCRFSFLPWYLKNPRVIDLFKVLAFLPFFCQITTNMAEKYISKRGRAMPKQKKASFGRHIQKNQQLRQCWGNTEECRKYACHVSPWALGEHLQGQIGRHLNRWDIQMQNLLLVGT